MAWNRSSNSKPTGAALRRGGTPRPTIVRGVIGGAVIIVGAAVAAWWLLTDDAAMKTTRPAEGNRGFIREVKPAATAKTVAQVTNQVDKDEKKVFRSNYSTKRMFASEEEMKEWERQNVTRPSVSIGKKVIPVCNYVESEICRVIFAKPGDMVLEYPMPPNFDEQMAAALLNKVKYEEDDTEEYKQEVIQLELAKAELRKLLKEGRNLREVLQSEAEALKKAAETKENVEAYLREIADDPNATLDDVKEAEVAANKLLEKHGVEVRVAVSMKARIDRGEIPQTNKESANDE